MKKKVYSKPSMKICYTCAKSRLCAGSLGALNPNAPITGLDETLTDGGYAPENFSRQTSSIWDDNWDY